MNQRKKTIFWLAASALFLLAVAVFGYLWRDEALVTDFSRKNLAPCLEYPFGTDFKMCIRDSRRAGRETGQP